MFENLSKSVKPIFKVHCIAFASKMLWTRIIENSEKSELKNDPVKQLNEKKPFYQRLFKMTLSGAQRCEIWLQHLQKCFKEALVEIYLDVDGSYATHKIIDDYVRECSRSSQRKS